MYTSSHPIIFHKDLYESCRWFELSLIEQLGNIGSEVGRTLIAKKNNDQEKFESAWYRMDELFRMTLMDTRWRKTGGLREVCRAKEVVLDFLFADNEYSSTYESIDGYFQSFGVMANEERKKRREQKKGMIAQ